MLVEEHSAYVINLKDIDLKLTAALMSILFTRLLPNALEESKETNWLALDCEQILHFVGKTGSQECINL